MVSISRRDIVIALGLMGCSLLGIGAVELVWGLAFSPTGDFDYDVIQPVGMVIGGIILLIVTNRLNLEPR
jgi:hypothetical protein